MTRDLSHRREAKQPPKKWGRWLVAALVLINVAVVLYHGDPRARLPKPTPNGSGTTHERPGAKRTGPRAAVDAATLDGGVSVEDLVFDADTWSRDGLDPLLGVRTSGPIQRVETVKLRSGQAPALALASLGVSPADVRAALDSLGKLVDFRRLRPGHKLKASLDHSGRLLALQVKQGATNEVVTARAGDAWNAERVEITIDTVVTRVAGAVNSTLWEAVIGAGEQPAFLAELADIFSSEVDFYRDVRAGDSFRALVEKRYARGNFIGYGRVVAAEYVNSGVVLRGFSFERADGGVSYYDEHGDSLRKQLLKSPLQYGRQTSGFGSRHHPVLGYTRQHNGVDYGVAIGTPVWSVGDGRVVRAGWGNGFGKVVEIAHPNGWTSQYAHLSDIGVRVGERVSQKQIVGKSGNTGLSSGPHLHYGLRKLGGYVNPAAQKFERAKALEGAELEKFKDEVQRRVETLTATNVASESHGAMPRDEG